MMQAFLWIIFALIANITVSGLAWWLGSENQFVMGLRVISNVALLGCVGWWFFQVVVWALPIMWGET